MSGGDGRTPGARGREPHDDRGHGSERRRRRRPFLERFPALERLQRAVGPRFPVIQQTAESDCGAACLTMVLAHHGKRLRLDEVRDTLGLGREGADALTLLRGGRHFGLRGRGVQVDDLDDLDLLPTGSLLHWGFHHWVVLEAVEKDTVLLADPGVGARRVTREELGKSFTGIALIFEPSEDFETGDERPRGARRHLREVLRQGSTLWRVLVMSLFLRLLALAGPLVTGILVDRVVPRGDYRLLTVLGVGLAGVTLFYFLSELVRAHLTLHLRTVLDARLTLEFLEHLVALPYAFFHQRSAGDLLLRLSSNTTIREILTSSTLTGVLDGLLVSLYLLLLYATHPGLATLVLGLGLARVVLFVLVRRRQAELMAKSLQTEARSRAYQVEMLSGIETLKALGAEDQAVERWSHLFVDELNVSLERGRLDAVFNSLLETLTVASPFFLLVFGIAEVLAGDLSLGTMLAVTALAAGFFTPLTSLVQTGVQLQLLGSYLERIDDVLDTEREQEETGEAAPLPAPRLGGRITVEAVDFRYSPLRPLVVEDVSLEIEPGSFVALVGESGAGKSTLAYLLMGLYPPTGGRVLYDGQDLAGLDLRAVRRQLGIVLQNPYLFAGPIRSNIALGGGGVPLHQVVAAARRAHIHDHIRSLPMGYETPLSDGGRSLSGGQRQRLALARALVRRPKILLLDEATSHLDAISEREVQDELERLEATRIVIAHRLSTVAQADQILVMEAGRIVERGRHGELLARGGAYARLVRAQLEGEGTEGDAAGSGRHDAGVDDDGPDSDAPHDDAPDGDPTGAEDSTGPRARTVLTGTEEPTENAHGE